MHPSRARDAAAAAAMRWRGRRAVRRLRWRRPAPRQRRVRRVVRRWAAARMGAPMRLSLPLVAAASAVHGASSSPAVRLPTCAVAARAVCVRHRPRTMRPPIAAWRCGAAAAAARIVASRRGVGRGGAPAVAAGPLIDGAPFHRPLCLSVRSRMDQPHHESRIGFVSGRALRHVPVHTLLRLPAACLTRVCQSILV